MTEVAQVQPLIAPGQKGTKRRRVCKVSLEEMQGEINKIIIRFTVYADLMGKVRKLRSGQALYLPANKNALKTDIVVSYRDLIAARSDLRNSLDNLVNFLRGRGKKKACLPSREDMSSSVYAPVLIYGPLAQFFSASTDFGGVDPTAQVSGTNPNIITQMPNLQAGRASRNLLTVMMFIYFHRHNLLNPANGQEFDPRDPLLTATFGQVPATYDRDPNTGTKMDNTRNATTYQILSEIPDIMNKKTGQISRFNANGWSKAFYIQTLLSVNYVTYNSLTPEDKREFTAAVREQMKDEFLLAKQTACNWQAILPKKERPRAPKGKRPPSPKKKPIRKRVTNR